MPKASRIALVESVAKSLADPKKGDVHDNLECATRLFNAHLQNRFGVDAPELTKSDIAMFGSLFWAGRLAVNPSDLRAAKRMIGFTACGAEVSEAK